MPMDLTVDLFHATVRISQQAPDGKYGLGTGFLVSAPRPDGSPRIVLVTADHVFSRKMLGETVQVGWRQTDVNGHWLYKPQDLVIRRGSTLVYTRHPTRDIAVIALTVPPEAAQAAIPLAWLADADSFTRYGVGPGDPIMAVGFPIGLSSTPEGFPILRRGVVASYPLSPVSQYPTFLADSVIVAGNSGGPVFMAQEGRRTPRGVEDVQMILGVVTQEVEYENHQLDIGVITHAAFVREAIALMDGAAAPPIPASASRAAAKGEVVN